MTLPSFIERQLVLAGLGRVDLSRRLTETRIFCADCGGESQLMRNGTCSGCAGRGWTPTGRGWRLVMKEKGFEAAPTGGARLRLVGDVEVAVLA